MLRFAYLISDILGKILALLVLLPWVIMPFLLVIVIIWHRKFSTGVFADVSKWRASPKAKTIFGIFVVGFLMLVIASAIPGKYIYNYRINQFFAIATHAPIMHVEMGDKKFDVTDSAAIQSFFEMVHSAHGAGAHHSHPVNQVRFSFPPTPEVYSIGPDSDQPDEYWLKLESSPYPAGSGICNLRQFTSREFTSWKKYYWNPD